MLASTPLALEASANTGVSVEQRWRVWALTLAWALAELVVASSTFSIRILYKRHKCDKKCSKITNPFVGARRLLLAVGSLLVPRPIQIEKTSFFCSGRLFSSLSFRLVELLIINHVQIRCKTLKHLFRIKIATAIGLFLCQVFQFCSVSVSLENWKIFSARSIKAMV